jgi:hypothetical protein
LGGLFGGGGITISLDVQGQLEEKEFAARKAPRLEPCTGRMGLGQSPLSRQLNPKPESSHPRRHRISCIENGEGHGALTSGGSVATSDACNRVVECRSRVSANGERGAFPPLEPPGNIQKSKQAIHPTR